MPHHLVVAILDRFARSLPDVRAIANELSVHRFVWTWAGRYTTFQQWRGRPARARWTLGGLAGESGQLFRCVRVGGANRISMASVMRGLEVFAGAE